MLRGICVLPVIPMRKTKSDTSEMTNQILFGEVFSIMKKTKNWSKIMLQHDNYEGWIDNKQYLIIKESNSKVSICNKKYCNISINNIKQPLLLGSFIPEKKSLRKLIGIKENLSFCKMKPFEIWFLKIAKKYLNSAYLWGGRTPLGIDCSGYTQMVYRFFNKKLPRDASQQVKKGKEIKKIENTELGDLAFFGKKNKITHVGIILYNNKIIHASGKVRIDQLDEKGIFNNDSNSYTHFLKKIKRIV